MGGILKFTLIGLILIAIGFCGWWYLLTPQPQSAAAQWHYLQDTLSFNTRGFRHLPDIKNMIQPDSNVSQAEADYWLEAAQGGNNVARIYIAQYLFDQGEKNPRAYQRALAFLRPAAAEGIPIAQNAMGVAYRLGLGVAQDNIEATKYFLLAANRGLRLAQDNLYQMSRKISADDMKEAKRRSMFELQE